MPDDFLKLILKNLEKFDQEVWLDVSEIQECMTSKFIKNNGRLFTGGIVHKINLNADMSYEIQIQDVFGKLPNFMILAQKVIICLGINSKERILTDDKSMGNVSFFEASSKKETNFDQIEFTNVKTMISYAEKKTTKEEQKQINSWF